LEDFDKSLTLMNSVPVVEAASGSGLTQKVLKIASKAASKSTVYLTDTKNLPQILKAAGLVAGSIFSFDYVLAEASHRTTSVTKVLEYYSNGTYSPDPDTRAKAAALRRRGVGLTDCCEPGTRYLNSELVENKYETFRPYETRRYLTLEQEKITLEQEKITLEQKVSALEQKVSALEKENKGLNFKEFPTID
jgi:hypothetical protein